MSTPPIVPADRLDVTMMTDRELLEEIVRSQRMTQQMVESFISAMEKNPMMKMMGKIGK